MTKNHNSALKSVQIDTKGDSKRVCELLLRKLYNSKYASSFVLNGDVLLYALLGNNARTPVSLTMISKLPDKVADEALASLGDKVAYSCSLPVRLEFGSPITPHPVMLDASAIWGEDFVSVPTMGVEALSTYAFDELMRGPSNPENAKHLYDIVALAMNYEMDGRVLYEAMVDTFEYNGTDFMPYPEAFELDESICNRYKEIVNGEGLKAPNYFIANEILNSLLWPVYTSMLSEKEFFGLWSPSTLSWTDYPKPVE